MIARIVIGRSYVFRGHDVTPIEVKHRPSGFADLVKLQRLDGTTHLHTAHHFRAEAEKNGW